MEIQGPGGVSGPNRLEPQKAAGQPKETPADVGSVGDHVEISDSAQWLDKLSQVPPVRTEKVEELRRLIDAGEYETPERIEGAVRKLLEELA